MLLKITFFSKAVYAVLFTAFLTIACMVTAHAQAEFEPWGNMKGIKLDGHSIPFTTCLTVAGTDDFTNLQSSGKERQHPTYSRNGNEQTVITQIGGIHLTEIVKSGKHGDIKLSISCVSERDTAVRGVYVEVGLPQDIYAGSYQTGANKERLWSAVYPNLRSGNIPEVAGSLKFKSGSKEFTIKSTGKSDFIVRFNRDTTRKKLHLFFPVCINQLVKDKVYKAEFNILVNDKIDRSDAVLKVDTTIQGRQFAGFGGNFRLQNPKTDQQVIDYCLKNMRVAWGRVEMPWGAWQPELSVNPIEEANHGGLNKHVEESMAMAARLGKMGMPVIVTAWAPPAWAVEGKLVNGKSPQGVWGNPLNKNTQQAAYRSITDYIIYLRDHYGLEASYFSFNESDLGINIRQTAEEHNELIKGLGAYFKKNNVKTKMLLGDNSDATTYRFIDVAMNDSATRPYIGAISFHSWRGWDTATLEKWATAAKRLNLPLIVGEGSIDASAWAYPAYFLEPSYALEEISLYTRLIAICQPVSILQWQLTADYSPLAGGGIFGDNAPLRPTQRFFNLKQMASTQANLYAMSVKTNQKEIVCAVLGDNAKHQYCFHIVNNGPSRKLLLTKMPASARMYTVFVTDQKRGMRKLDSMPVKNHEASLNIDAGSYVTLISEAGTVNK